MIATVSRIRPRARHVPRAPPRGGLVGARADADTLWQEWQVVGQARQLAGELMIEAQARTSYAQAYDLLAQRHLVLQRALAAGNTTLVTAAPSLVAFQAARTNLQALDQRLLARRHRLNALLGLLPDATVPLAATPDLPAFDPAQVRASLATLADRRPDLLAQARPRRAGPECAPADPRTIPRPGAGRGGKQDNAYVYNAGPQASIGPPVFDRNQGNIALAEATRQCNPHTAG